MVYNNNNYKAVLDKTFFGRQQSQWNTHIYIKILLYIFLIKVRTHALWAHTHIFMFININLPLLTFEPPYIAAVMHIDSEKYKAALQYNIHQTNLGF